VKYANATKNELVNHLQGSVEYFYIFLNKKILLKTINQFLIRLGKQKINFYK
jgi:hypothetical protein